MKSFRQFREAFGRNSALNWNVTPAARAAGGPPEGEVTYHKSIGLPKDFSKPKGLRLRYGQHSLDRAREKGIILPAVLPAVYDIIEVSMVKYRVTKWVLRFPVSVLDDVVMAVLPDGMVKTAWLNDKNDKHDTLDRSKYAAAAGF